MTGTPTDSCKMLGNADVWLMRTYWDFDFPHPLLPNFMYVGGIHCRPAKPLPKVWLSPTSQAYSMLNYTITKQYNEDLYFKNIACVTLLLQDMEEFVQSSGDAGTVVFTLGSLIKNITREKGNMIASALAQIPQKVKNWQLKGYMFKK